MKLGLIKGPINRTATIWGFFTRLLGGKYYLWSSRHSYTLIQLVKEESVENTEGLYDITAENLSKNSFFGHEKIFVQELARSKNESQT